MAIGNTALRALAIDDVADAIRRHIEVAGQGVDTNAEGNHEFFAENFSRRDRIEFLRCQLTSVVVDDLDVEGIAVAPTKTDTPLIVDPDAVLASSVAFQRFEPVAWRNHQVVQRAGTMLRVP